MRTLAGLLYPKGRRARRRLLRRWLVLAAVLCGGAAMGGCIMTRMPGRSYQGPFEPLNEQELQVEAQLTAHIRRLAGDIGERNLRRYTALQQAADYITQQFTEIGYAPRIQEFEVDGQQVRNIEVELPGASRVEEIVVVGGHYDSVYGSPGANDNATGTAAVLEIARLLKDTQAERTVRFVAFVNEEPPFFKTDGMGSLVYARRSRQRQEKVVAMMSIETIGFYSNDKGSQSYPPPLSLCYPDTGNFVAFVGNLSSRSLVCRSISSFRSHTNFPSEGGALPGWLTGIGWSDHWAFWQAGYPALMVTDTAPFRYAAYHTRQDMPDTIDHQRPARVTSGLARVVSEVANPTKK